MGIYSKWMPKGTIETGQHDDNGGGYYGASNVDDYHNQHLINQLGNRRRQLLERYIQPALLLSLKDLHRHLVTREQQSSSTYDNFVKWL